MAYPPHLKLVSNQSSLRTVFQEIHKFSHIKTNNRAVTFLNQFRTHASRYRMQTTTQTTTRKYTQPPGVKPNSIKIQTMPTSPTNIWTKSLISMPLCERDVAKRQRTRYSDLPEPLDYI